MNGQGNADVGGTGGHRPSKVKPERAWLLGAIGAESDLTLAALSVRLLDARGVKANTGMLSRFFRSEGIRFKKKRSTQRTGPARCRAQAGPLEAASGKD